MIPKSSTSIERYKRTSLVRNAIFIIVLASVLFSALAWRGRIEAPAPPVTAEASTSVAGTPAPPLVVEVRDPRADAHQRLGDYLATRYRISADVATEIVSKAHSIGSRLELDPALILAIISVESRFNPSAESHMGAKGLMQVIPRFHADKLASVGGESMVFELEPNILVGSRILKEYLRHTGDLFDALQMYVGASSEEDASAYSEKVTRERDRLNNILRRRPPAT